MKESNYEYLFKELPASSYNVASSLHGQKTKKKKKKGKRENTWFAPARKYRTPEESKEYFEDWLNSELP